MINLNSEITDINRVGLSTAKRLNKLGIKTVLDLLFYFPYRYDDFNELTPIDKLIPGASANIVGQIELIQNKRSHRRKMFITEALVSDNTESLKIIWFNQPFIARNLRVGDRVSFAGKVDDDQSGMVMKSPTYEKLSSNSPIHTQGLVPNYHLTANITQKQIRFLINQITNLSKFVSDWLPAETKKNLKLIDLGQALKKIHFPENLSESEDARRRLAFDELFLVQIEAQLIKKELKNSQSQAVTFLEAETKRFVASLPWPLTNAQRKSAWEILLDMAKDRPMSRLLEGDVGSGKTVVAVMAMLNAVRYGQAVLMAPTEILARQHFNSITKLLDGFNIPVALITRTEKKIWPAITDNGDKKPKKIDPSFLALNSKIIIGTHALIQEKIKFNNLVLAVVDEQHRFGVEQRKKLMEKTGNKKLTPHLLSMTATPIPRSLALALYGDLDLSIINEMPKGRKKIITQLIPENKRNEAYNFVREQINTGRQIFVICPLIDPSDSLGVKSVKAEFEKLDKNIFPDLKIGLLHGKMKSTEKERIMQDFLDNKIKILVATSVIEVGVDVPNATVMMIEGAERFGLAQLHQFRGRVGRSDFQSYCFLFSENLSGPTWQRLDTLTKYNDGITLAKMDLKFRGAGEIYGTAQKGFPELKIASLFDYALMKQAQEEAVKIINDDPKLNKYPEIKERLGDWKKNIHLE